MLEKARGERFIGSALEAKVLLHVADAGLAQSLQGLQGVGLCHLPLGYHSGLQRPPEAIA